jgi:regulator of sigma E protease
VTENPGILLTIAAFLLLLGPLVFVHELGHYLAGRWFGVKSEVFSIGFGRELFGWTDRLGTRWKVAWLPLGGYVKFAGDMNAGSQPDPAWLALPAAERAKTFQAKPLWQRAIIVAAGPLINLALAVLILAGFAYLGGDRVTPPVVGGIVENSAAARAGLQPGDRITAIDGRTVDRFDELVLYVTMRPAETVGVTIARGAAVQTLPLTLGQRLERDRFGNEYRIGSLGVTSGEQEVVPVSLLQAPLVGLRKTGAIIGMMWDTLGQIVTGRRSMEELGGPLRIAQVSGGALSIGWGDFIGLVALISINLGFINLLPVPMLDGGHLMFYAIEAVRRKPVGSQAQEWAYRGGLAAILALMLVVTINDLGAFGVWRGLAGLIG